MEGNRFSNFETATMYKYMIMDEVSAAHWEEVAEGLTVEQLTEQLTQDFIDMASCHDDMEEGFDKAIAERAMTLIKPVEIAMALLAISNEDTAKVLELARRDPEWIHQGRSQESAQQLAYLLEATFADRWPDANWLEVAEVMQAE